MLVDGARFNIGRAPDNDLVLGGPGVAQRQAVISTIFGATFITNCDARGGTTLNGRKLAGKTRLSDGDLIGLGAAGAARVKLAPRPLARLLTLAANRAALAALASAAAVLIVALTAAALFKAPDRGEASAPGEETTAEAEAEAKPAGPEARPEPSAAAPENAPPPAPTSQEAPRDEGGRAAESDSIRIELAAVQVLRRIGRDDRPHALNPRTLEDISEKVEEYSQSPRMGDALRQVRGGVPSVVARARSEGIEPALVVYAALAQTGGARGGGDAAAAARALLPELVNLSKTLGGVGADSNLIVLAAYTEGAGSKRSHPLLARLRQSVNRPLAERNVWYLHERGIINERAYSFVVSFLACGIIAHDPRKFGVDAEALPL